MKIKLPVTILASVIIGLGVSLAAGEEERPISAAKKPGVAEKLTPAQILKHLGSEGREAGTEEEVAAYSRHFDRIDLDGDGSVSREEYVEKGTYLNARARAGIFGASDADKNGSVSREEYVVNRRITDEAKAIMARMDEDGDGSVTRNEFLKGSGIEEKTVAAAIFDQLDTNGDGSTFIPEYLRVWGAWARADPKTGKVKVNAPPLFLNPI